MPEANAVKPEAPGIDFNTIIELIKNLAPLIPVILQFISSLPKKSAYARAHGLKDPVDSFNAFVDDYNAVHKAMAEQP